jgi:O-antigen ligase
LIFRRHPPSLRVIFFLSAATLALTPLFRGGNAFVAVSSIAAFALLLGLALFVYTRGEAIPQADWRALLPFVLAIVLLGGYGVLGTTQISVERWLAMPGRSFYAFAVTPQHELAGSVPAKTFLSLNPSASALSALVAIVSLFIAFSAIVLPKRVLIAVFGALAVLAVMQSTLGLAQVALRSPSFLVYDGGYVGVHRAIGTFVNKNHLATFLAMTLPFVILRATGKVVFFSDRKQPTTTALSTTWWCFGAVVILFALLSTLSRAGVAAAAISCTLIVALVALVTPNRSNRMALFAAALGIVVLGAVFLGSTLLGNFSVGAIAEASSGRAAIAQSTITAAKAFFPWGAGLGSFSTVFHRFQSPEFAGYVDHAHNDYLQLLLETGFVAIVVFVLLAVAAITSLSKIIVVCRTRKLPLLAITCWLGAFAFAFHAFFDFPAHIPGVLFTVIFLFSATFNGAIFEDAVVVEPLPQKPVHDQRRRRSSSAR